MICMHWCSVFVQLHSQMFLHLGFLRVHGLLIMYVYQTVLTRVDVKLAFHRLGDALQLDGLQAVGVDSCGQAAQRLPDEAGHLPHREDLQQLAINCRERAQEHRLAGTEQCSVIRRRLRICGQKSFSSKLWNHCNFY